MTKCTGSNSSVWPSY